MSGQAVILVKSVQRFLSSINPLRIDVEDLGIGIEAAQRQLDKVVLLIDDDEESTDDEQKVIIKQLQNKIEKARAVLDG